ncbi:hypothetical protein [Algoriphagus sp. A40]|uniref:hypothetical protein n=1 Tax=Algoriphagus sp. A40 TaxID=1945863 RepID=UPI0009867294|nr:hypothetical protein [Algoriphagus sp. A40]
MIGEPVEIPFGRTVTHCTEPISVTFLDLISDSRCPIGATCIWAGMVEVRISVNLNGQEEVFNLSSAPNFGNKVPNIQTIEGYSVELVDLKPFPDTSKKVDEKDRQVVLLIKKVGSGLKE